MRTYQDLIAIWPTVADFARDIGVGYQTARKMRDRNSVGSKYWKTVIQAACARGVYLTAEDLLRMSRTSRARREKVNRSGTRVAA